MAVAEAGPGAARARRPVVTGPRDAALRVARTCCDHLAGRGLIELSADGGAVTPDGAAFLQWLGVDLPAAETQTARRSGRVLCRPCLDWSERRPHVAGAVGAALCTRCFALGWVYRIEGTRALTVTPAGLRGTKASFGVEAG